MHEDFLKPTKVESSWFVTRFAPSPTGTLHLGGVRTALFNYLWAKRRGSNSKFILRIDDTDEKRGDQSAIKPILDGLNWLGLEYDGPYYQSTRIDLYRSYVKRLIDAGFAYPCTKGPNDIEAEIDRTKTGKLSPFRGGLRNQPAAVCHNMLDAESLAIRFKVPDNEIIKTTDLVRNNVQWDTNDIGDPVIMRHDGSPLYNLATVVDDIEMGITHVIRGDEHLTNTVIQLMIYYALSKKPPLFAHLPQVLEPDGSKKLSKRDAQKFLTADYTKKFVALGYRPEDAGFVHELNPVGIGYYKEMGYPPTAILNYLMRLGWSLDDKTEMFSIHDMIMHFDFTRVVKSPARFDFKKLNWYVGEYSKKISIEQRATGCLPFMQRAGYFPNKVPLETYLKFMEIIKYCGDRIKSFSDIVVYAAPFYQTEPQYDHDTVQKRIRNPQMEQMLLEYVATLEQSTSWEQLSLEDAMSEFCHSKDISGSVLIHATRCALTGQPFGLSLFDTMVLFGQEECVKRIKETVHKVQKYDI